MKYLFLDANIYLHCKDYEQLDWGKIIPTMEEITIVVPPITRAEIDKIKDKGTGKVNKRARDFSRKFKAVFLDGVQRKISMISCNAPKAKYYEEYDLDKSSQDNQFVLSAILYQKSTGHNVVIVARDTNLLITAKDKGLEYLYLPDEYCLKPELSEEEKQLSLCQKELEKYKNRISKPSLTFENGKTFLKVKKPIFDDPEPIIIRAIADELLANPFIRLDDKPVDDPLVAMTSITAASKMSAFKLKPEEIQRYNKELSEYHNEYEDYIRLKIFNDILIKQIFELKFIVSNNGNAPTGDLEIFINFPTMVKLYDSTSQKSVDLDTPPLKPDPPSFSRSPLFSREMKKHMQYIQAHPMSLASYEYVDNGPKIWDLDKTVGHEYHFSKDSLLQTLHYGIFFDYGIHIDLMQCGNFAIEYTIVDASLPNPITGVLNFILE